LEGTWCSHGILTSSEKEYTKLRHTHNHWSVGGHEPSSAPVDEISHACELPQSLFRIRMCRTIRFASSVVNDSRTHFISCFPTRFSVFVAGLLLGVSFLQLALLIFFVHVPCRDSCMFCIKLKAQTWVGSLEWSTPGSSPSLALGINKMPTIVARPEADV